jgi:hypothetical protein
MQNRYVGDIGDYVKLAILRALMPGRRLGVVWWLVPDENHNSDGRHISYLTEPEKWRHYDPDLFDGLGKIVESGTRSIGALESAQFLPNTRYFSDPIPLSPRRATRLVDRQRWFAGALSILATCDLCFVDPDNGIEPARFRFTQKSSGKSVSFEELAAMRCPSRTLIVYHHHTRRKGGHVAELAFQANRLRQHGLAPVDALRSRPYSPRAFFLIDANELLRNAAQELANRWHGHIDWHPDPR